MHRIVAITGASAGIGRATALALATTGATVAICARRVDRLHDVADAVQRAGGTALVVRADVTSEADMEAFVARALDTYGRLDVMICNAGFGIYGTLEQIDGARMRRLIDVNYLGTYHAARAAVPVFRRQRHGHLVVVSSIVGKRGVPYMGAYAATKFAQAGLAESLRAELRGTGIHVTTVYPVSTETEFFDVMTRESGFATRATGPRQTADVVGQAIAGAVERPAAEVFPYGMSRGLAALAALAPRFTDRLVQRWSRKPVE